MSFGWIGNGVSFWYRNNTSLPFFIRDTEPPFIMEIKSSEKRDVYMNLSIRPYFRQCSTHFHTVSVPLDRGLYPLCVCICVCLYMCVCTIDIPYVYTIYIWPHIYRIHLYTIYICMYTVYIYIYHIYLYMYQMKRTFSTFRSNIKSKIHIFS